MSIGRNLYKHAEDFLYINFNLDKDILEPYLTPDKVKNINQLYERFLLSAKNKSQGGGAIENVFGTPDSKDDAKKTRWTKLKEILCDFNPHKVVKKYPTVYDFFHILRENEFKPITTIDNRKLNPENPNSTVYLYCLSILDSAKFLSEFNNLKAFIRKINNNPEQGVKDLQQISGLGDALSRDLLKGLGYVQLVKSDVHTKTIAIELEIVKINPKDVEVSKALQKLATEINVTPFALDRLLWLIGSGNFFERDAHTNEQKERIQKAIEKHNKNVRTQFIEYVKSKNS